MDIAMVVRGMTLREIRELLLEQYGTHVSPRCARNVTNFYESCLFATKNL